MTLSRLLRGGRIVDPSAKIDAIGDLLIGPDGMIEAVGGPIDPGRDVPISECAGLIVAPGLIDMHVHLRVPGQEYKEDMASGTAAARAGGFTAIACQPNTSPAIDHASIVGQILDLARAADARVHVIAAVSRGLENKELTEMSYLKEAGAVGVGDDAFPVAESSFLRRAMEYCSMLDLPYIAHCEDKWLTGDGVMNEGYVSTVLGLKGIPRTAENAGTARNILIATDTGCRLHILHVSTKESVEIIRQAKKLGAPITAETCPQYLVLTDESCIGYETDAKMSPPLRTFADQEALKQGLADGTIDVIATDHAPHAPHEKEQEFDRAPFGMIGLETSLGLVLTHLVKPGILTLSQAIEKMSWAPARVLKVAGGTLAVGVPADITVIDPEIEWKVDVNLFRSKSRNTVLNGISLTGRAVATYVGGRGGNSI